jgi:outer membrane protein assembly factor BamB
MARTSTEGATPAAADQRLCPRCGRPVAAESVRCRFCLADVREVEAGVGVAREGETRTGLRRWVPRIPQIRHRWTRRRGFAVALAVLVVFFVGRWVYGNYIATPGPLPLPSASAITLTGSPRTWPTANGGLNARRTTEASPALDGEVAWQVELPATVLRPPVADEERLYITHRDSIAALALDDGRELWRVERPGLLSAPSIVGSRLYLALRTGDVVAMEADGGEVIWSTQLGEELFTTPVPFRGTLYVYAPGRVYGLDAEGGARLWDRGVEGSFAELPPVIDDEHFVVAARKAVVFYDRETGERTFRHPHTSLTGLIFGDELVFSVSPAFAAGIDPDSSLPWWEGVRLYWNWLWALGAAPEPPRPEVDWVTRVRPSDLRSGAGLTLMFRPAYDGERLIASDSTGLVRAFDPSTGALRWETELESLHGPPTFTADGLVVPMGDRIGLLDPADGSEIAHRAIDRLELRIKRWVVVLEQGTFVVDATGSVLAIR